jgi:hypothetical protein
MTPEERREFDERLWSLRHAILQFLHEPTKELERMKKEAISIKELIEDIVVTEYKEEKQ